MSSKRALVVDDSKSARAFLSRILERHEITVDAAESAEAAIEYLARNKPDVIFMDHMMPGMDGFQAVQSIKNNPRTSTIPILMYTSQEGDLYLGQARALGAEGVLPKQIKQSDVTKMLYQLRLVSDRRGTLEQTAFTRLAAAPEHPAANESAIDSSAADSSSIVVQPPPVVMPAPVEPAAGIAQLLPQLSLEIRAAFDQTLKTELASLRGFIGTALDSHVERLHGDLAALAPPARTPDLDMPTLIAERRPWGAIAGWVLALLAAGGAAYMSWQWWQQGAQIEALRTDLAAAYAEVETLRARPAIVSPPVPAAESPMDGAAVPPIEPGAMAESAAPPALASDAAIPVEPPPATPSAITAPAVTAPAATPLPAQIAPAPAIIQAQ
jgi:CheY-like chemotaxis protein